MEQNKTDTVKMMNPTALAYMGDAVYELYIREMLLGRGSTDIDRIHKVAVRYVSSQGQSTAVKAMIDEFLTEEEARLVKRARNRRTSSRPKNADIRNYKWATGFEALLGWLYLSEQRERLDQVMAEAVRIIEA